MADHLFPNNNLSNLDKQKIFAIRNKMIEIPNNFPMGNKLQLRRKRGDAPYILL